MLIITLLALVVAIAVYRSQQQQGVRRLAHELGLSAGSSAGTFVGPYRRREVELSSGQGVVGQTTEVYVSLALCPARAIVVELAVDRVSTAALQVRGTPATLVDGMREDPTLKQLLQRAIVRSVAVEEDELVITDRSGRHDPEHLASLLDQCVDLADRIDFLSGSVSATEVEDP